MRKRRNRTTLAILFFLSGLAVLAWAGSTQKRLHQRNVRVTPEAVTRTLRTGMTINEALSHLGIQEERLTRRSSDPGVTTVEILPRGLDILSPDSHAIYLLFDRNGRLVSGQAEDSHERITHLKFARMSDRPGHIKARDGHR